MIRLHDVSGLTKAAFFIVWAGVSALAQDAPDPAPAVKESAPVSFTKNKKEFPGLRGIHEQELRDAAVASGFRDPWVDELHESLRTEFRAFLGNFNSENLPDDGRVTFSKNTAGEDYAAVRLYQGTVYEDQDRLRPVVQEVTAFLFYTPADQSLNRIQIQIDRKNTFVHYPFSREVRRISFTLSGEKSQSLNQLKLEFYRNRLVKDATDSLLPDQPEPESSWNLIPENPEDRMPYENQIQMLDLYKNNLRRASEVLSHFNEMVRSGKVYSLEKTFDF